MLRAALTLICWLIYVSLRTFYQDRGKSFFLLLEFGYHAYILIIEWKTHYPNFGNQIGPDKKFIIVKIFHDCLTV